MATPRWQRRTCSPSSASTLAGVMFDTHSGSLAVCRGGEAATEMDFPADPPRRIETPPGLETALGMRVVETWVAAYLVAVLDGPAALVRGLKPGPRRRSRRSAWPRRRRGAAMTWRSPRAGRSATDHPMTWRAGSSRPAPAFPRLRRPDRRALHPLAPVHAGGQAGPHRGAFELPPGLSRAGRWRPRGGAGERSGCGCAGGR